MERHANQNLLSEIMEIDGYPAAYFGVELIHQTILDQAKRFGELLAAPNRFPRFGPTVELHAMRRAKSELETLYREVAL